MPVGAIIGLVATAASITAQAVAAKKAREAQLGVKGTSAGEQSMLSIQKMKATDMAQMGGLSPGRYQREMMDHDISAMQTQALVTKMGENPFADAFKKEAFARVALSELRSSMQKRQMQISDLDAETLAKNTFAAHEMAKDTAIAESRILDRENQIKLLELEKKQQTYQTMARLMGSGAKAVGQLAQHASERGVFDSWGKSKQDSLSAKPQMDALSSAPEGVFTPSRHLPSGQQAELQPLAKQPLANMYDSQGRLIPMSDINQSGGVVHWEDRLFNLEVPYGY